MMSRNATGMLFKERERGTFRMLSLACASGWDDWVGMFFDVARLTFPRCERETGVEW